jgi:hypothetical protein
LKMPSISFCQSACVSVGWCLLVAPKLRHHARECLAGVLSPLRLFMTKLSPRPCFTSSVCRYEAGALALACLWVAVALEPMLRKVVWGALEEQRRGYGGVRKSI